MEYLTKSRNGQWTLRKARDPFTDFPSKQSESAVDVKSREVTDSMRERAAAPQKLVDQVKSGGRSPGRRITSMGEKLVNAQQRQKQAQAQEDQATEHFQNHVHPDWFNNVNDADYDAYNDAHLDHIKHFKDHGKHGNIPDEFLQPPPGATASKNRINDYDHPEDELTNADYDRETDWLDRRSERD